MEASGSAPAAASHSSTPSEPQPAGPSFLQRLRAFTLGIEERITPSEVQDVLSGVVALLDHAGLDIPQPEPAAVEQAAATEEQLRSQNAALQAELAQLRSQQSPSQPSEPPAPSEPAPADV